MIEKFTDDIVIKILKILNEELHYNFLICGSLALYIRGIKLCRPIKDIDIIFVDNQLNTKEITHMINICNKKLKNNNIDLMVDVFGSSHMNIKDYVDYSKKNYYKVINYNFKGYKINLVSISNSLETKIAIKKRIEYIVKTLTSMKTHLLNIKLKKQQNKNYDNKLYTIVNYLNCNYGDDFIIEGSWAAYLYGYTNDRLLTCEFPILSNNEKLLQLTNLNMSFLFKDNTNIRLFVSKNIENEFYTYNLNNLIIKYRKRSNLIKTIINNISCWNKEIQKHNDDIILINQYIKNGNL